MSSRNSARGRRPGRPAPPAGGGWTRAGASEHRHAETGRLDHLEVVLLVPHRDGPLERHRQVVAEAAERHPLDAAAGMSSR